MKYEVTRKVYKYITVNANGEADASQKADNAWDDEWGESPDYEEWVSVQGSVKAERTKSLQQTTAAIRRELLELRDRVSLHGDDCRGGCIIKTVENEDECDGYLFARLTALGSE